MVKDSSKAISIFFPCTIRLSMIFEKKDTSHIFTEAPNSIIISFSIDQLLYYFQLIFSYCRTTNSAPKAFIFHEAILYVRVHIFTAARLLHLITTAKLPHILCIGNSTKRRRAAIRDDVKMYEPANAIIK